MIAATLSLADAAQRSWDVIIAGAGPAGAFLARQLALQHVSVLLVDRATFPRWKVCGCCLNPIALRVLDSAGLRDRLDQHHPVPLTQLALAVRQRQAILRLPPGRALSREAFDAELIQAALEVGAAFLPATQASLQSGSARAGRDVRLRQAQEQQIARTKVLIAADGLNSTVLADEPGSETIVSPQARMGAGLTLPEGPPTFQPGTIYMTCGPHGYVGLVRLEDGRLDLAAALDRHAVREQSGPGPVVDGLLRQSGWPGLPSVADWPWRGTPPLTRWRPRLAGARYFVLGDAAGYVEPFTGEGMAWALLSAQALTPLVREAVLRWDDRLVERWQVRHRRLLWSRRRLCAGIAQVLRYPGLLTQLLPLLRWTPRLADPVIQRLSR